MADWQLNTPVAFIIFNRPDTTARVFAEIAKAKPPKLLVVADGPRKDKEGEAEKCAATRAIINQVDWPCEILTNYSDINLGCKNRVASGLDWVFEQVEEAIVLEDDCLPSISFFVYCEQMLKRYKYDKRIFSISGSNFSPLPNKRYGHLFSRYSLMWGWATWADRWSKYILNPKDQSIVLLRRWWSKPLTFVYWFLIFNKVREDKINTWDYQWILTVWRANALACRPSHNLVKNIGFGIDATHTSNSDSPLASLSFFQGEKDFSYCLTNVQPDKYMEAQDEKLWANIRFRAILGLKFPSLLKLKTYFKYF